MIVAITGTTSGMGNAIAHRFVDSGHTVHGLDILPAKDSLQYEPLYIHHIANICDFDELPTIDNIDILVNNAGVQGTDRDIEINLKGLINVTSKYALNNLSIKSVINMGAASATMGTEQPEYVASKGGVLSYTKWTAKEVAKYGATCNSLSFGGVLTDSNKPVTDNKELWDQVMELTPLKRWTDVTEVANWVYFLACYNKSCSGQNIVIDNLESLNGVFVWE